MCADRSTAPFTSSGAPTVGASDLLPTMRLFARFVFLMVAVFGVSLAFAWAWDRSEAPPSVAQVHGA